MVCGRNALIKMREPGSIVYRGFKMVLAESNEKIRCERGYDSVITPERVTETYIRFLFDRQERVREFVGLSNICYTDDR